jgi:hypothetical protein
LCSSSRVTADGTRLILAHARADSPPASPSAISSRSANDIRNGDDDADTNKPAVTHNPLDHRTHIASDRNRDLFLCLSRSDRLLNPSAIILAHALTVIILPAWPCPTSDQRNTAPHRATSR